MAELTGDSETPNDYVEHEKTYASVLHMMRWFVLHTALMLIGLYFLLIPQNGWAGSFFVVVGVIVLGYGVVSMQRARDRARNPARWHAAPAELEPRQAWPVSGG